MKESIVPIGKNTTFLTPRADTALELIVNDDGKASGSFSVTIGVGVRPAQGTTNPESVDFSNQRSVTLLPKETWKNSQLYVTKGTPILFIAKGILTGTSLPTNEPPAEPAPPPADDGTGPGLGPAQSPLT